jgi:hypothetical protein
MNYLSVQTIAIRIGLVGLLVLAYRWYDWMGVLGALGVVVMWMLIEFSRMVRVLQRAAARPVGYVDSAVMFNVALRPGMALTRVLAVARALGQSASEAGQQPEIFVWTDPGNVQVRCIFQNGKLASWTLERPPEEEALAAP